ncbi:hypothetical protein BC829DRAFT_393120 [Chytridium lagenaria]|nr:hypothetical protein BC829DRAFT_393120 [Chytridium lagenaria]
MSQSNPVILQTSAGDFAVGEEIGRGSFATVYIARRTTPSATTPNLSAVKTVNRDKLNRKLAENLETEIKILKGIRHDHIVGLMDIVKTEKHIHLVMEYCSMGDLSVYIKRKGMVMVNDGSGTMQPSQLPPPITDPSLNPIAGSWGGLNEFVVRHYLKQLSSAIEFLRSQSLIHRDLKPQNLLLNPAAPDTAPITIPSPFRTGRSQTISPLPTLKLADFGFARALPPQSLASTLCGSPLYMAPEILRGDRYDAKADLWSLGAICYEMLTGRPPFKAQNHIDLLRKIDRGEGFIKFPGEEEARRSVMVQGGLSSSPRTQVTPLPVGSLGSSPRFTQMNVNALPIADDLKDLIRRLLKRNPVERMSFEEFFMHPCVAEGLSGGNGGMVVEKIEGRSVDMHPRSIPKSLNSAMPRTSSESLRQMQEAAALGASRRRSMVEVNVPGNTIVQGNNNTHSVPNSGKVSTIEAPRTHNTTTVTYGVVSPQQTPRSIPSQNLEPPFPGYNVDAAALFVGLSEPEQVVPLLEVVSPSEPTTRPHAQSRTDDGKHLVSPTDERDPLSSLSSLGSLEFSEDGEENERIVHIVRRNGSGENSGKTPTPTRDVERQKASFEDFVVVEKKAVEVNWIAEDGAGGLAAALTGGFTASPSTSSEREREQKGVVFGGSGAGYGAGSGSPSGTPPSPRMSSGRETLGKGRVFGSLRDSTHNFLNAATNPMPTPPHTNPTYFPPSPPTRPSLPLHSTTPSDPDDPTPLLSALNLCALRGHALNLLADERYRDFITLTTAPIGGAITNHSIHQPPTPTPEAPGTAAAEECVALYLTALGLYQMGIEAAKAVWGGGAGKVDVTSLSAAVQWIRERFGECLERAQEVRGFLGEEGEGGEAGNAAGTGVGRPVERVVYERAVEIARVAAQAEQGTDTSTAEAGYTQAVLLLEAILSSAAASSTSNQPFGDVATTGLNDPDRAVVERFVGSLGMRLERVREGREGVVS